MTILGTAQAARGGEDPAASSGYADHPPRMGFFTDTSVCIGCKACEVACKEWNGVPDDGFDLLGMSFDNTGELSANTWRHVAFIEQPAPELVDPALTEYAFVSVPWSPHMKGNNFRAFDTARFEVLDQQVRHRIFHLPLLLVVIRAAFRW